ncbi:DUF3048 domain-containing protein [Clostridium sp. MSJ-11]|uniref:DUF3048 domain-containing protein n=1 Tax=Clostridium mobile TaxID=2841512 RepID=A0ABS6ELU1_9CLOT|nr:DUF3048 domain-containing protein [Clostridium mobile]MBU5486195.1 DUF3048 domain-containing protein [Clostridium mobile]
MKKILVLIFSIFLLVGCNKPPEIKEEVKKEQPKEEEKFFSPYTGEEIDKDTYFKIPFMVIVENSKTSRPHSGLIHADVVYETMAEGGISRFMAIYHKDDSPKIGPVRSARPYFLDIAIENNLPFAHCGYSEEAKNRIEKEKLPSLNEFLYEKFYWRDKNRPYEHSLYTSSNLRELIKEQNLIKSPSKSLYFNSDFWQNTLDNAEKVSLNVNKYYNTSYVFNNNKYTKYMDGEKSIDAEKKIPIEVNNIIIQLTDITLQKDNLHIDVRLIGEGDCYIISNGKYIKGRWSKKDSNSPTVFLDKDNKEIPLSPGKTWWHIFDNKIKVAIE